jgi:PEP-CTERM motif
MRKILLTTIALAGVGAVSPVSANTVDVGYSFSAGGTPSTIATTSTPGAASYEAALMPYLSNIDTGTDFFPLDLGGSTQDTAKGGTKAIYLYISETGITYDQSKVTFQIGLAENRLPTGWSVTESVYSDSSNTAYGEGTLLATDTFGAAGGTKLVTLTSPVPFGTPFSVTEEIAIKPGSGNGHDLSSVSISTVPEASTWAMMTLGFAGLGYAAFRRSAKSGPVAEAI